MTSFDVAKLKCLVTQHTMRRDAWYGGGCSDGSGVIRPSARWKRYINVKSCYSPCSVHEDCVGKC